VLGSGRRRRSSSVSSSSSSSSIQSSVPPRRESEHEKDAKYTCGSMLMGVSQECLVWGAARIVRRPKTRCVRRPRLLPQYI